MASWPTILTQHVRFDAALVLLASGTYPTTFAAVNNRFPAPIALNDPRFLLQVQMTSWPFTSTRHAFFVAVAIRIAHGAFLVGVGVVHYGRFAASGTPSGESSRLPCSECPLARSDVFFSFVDQFPSSSTHSDAPDASASPLVGPVSQLGSLRLRNASQMPTPLHSQAASPVLSIPVHRCLLFRPDSTFD